MPRVNGFTATQKAKDKSLKLKRLIICVMKEKKITQKELGEELGMSQQSFGYSLRTMTLKPDELFFVLDKLGILFNWEEQ